MSATFWHVKIGGKVEPESFVTREEARVVVRAVKAGYKLLPGACPDIREVAFTERPNGKPEPEPEQLPFVPAVLGGEA